MEKIIEFRNTNFAYDKDHAFNDFSMEINKGDVVTLIGTPASGKSTLLKMLCHQLPNDSIYYKERSINSYNLNDLRSDIIVIFDGPLTENTVEEEITKYARKIKIEKNVLQERYEEILKTFDLPTILGKDIKRLSKKEELLIKILRYLIIKPKFIAIDGLLTPLSKDTKKAFFNYIKNNKITVLNVTTDLDDSLFGNKLFVLDNFVLILEGSTLSVLKTDTLLKRLGFKLPVAVDLSIELNHYDVLKKIITDNEKLVNALWK